MAQPDPSSIDARPPSRERANGLSDNGIARKSVRFVRLAVAMLIAAMLALALLLPIRFPAGVNTYATITPASRWVLAKATDGQLISSTFNYRSGLSEGFRVSTFNQGSSIYFALHPALAPGRAVTVGDTIATIYSTDVAERLVALQGQLAAARGALAVNATGQKTAVVTEAEQRLAFARRRKHEHLKVEQRTQTLYEQRYISQGEYDRVQSEANALTDEIAIAEANLEVAKTGAKPEQLELSNANIASLVSEIEAVKRRANTLVLTAPISGTVTPTYSGDTLLTIAASEFLALIPVRRADYPRVASTTQARVTVQGLSKAVHGTLIGLNSEFRVMGGREVLIAVGRLETPTTEVMPGMLVKCRIHCAPVTAAEYGRQVLQLVAASQPLLGGF